MSRRGFAGVLIFAGVFPAVGIVFSSVFPPFRFVW